MKTTAWIGTSSGIGINEKELTTSTHQRPEQDFSGLSFHSYTNAMVAFPTVLKAHHRYPHLIRGLKLHFRYDEDRGDPPVPDVEVWSPRGYGYRRQRDFLNYDRTLNFRG